MRDSRDFATGDRVLCNGYPGVVDREAPGVPGMIGVRMTRGGVVVPASELKRICAKGTIGCTVPESSPHLNCWIGEQR